MTRGVAIAALCAAVLAGGCQRRSTVFQSGEDSTAVASDAGSAALHDAQEAWTSGTPDQAAQRTAEALFDDLRRHPPAEWKDRATELLDSLGVGAETGGGACAVLVNFFSRSDPTAGSWPYLYWCAPQGPRFEPVEGKGLRLADAMVRSGDPNAPKDKPSQFAAAWSRVRGGRSEPVLYVWRLGANDTPALFQSLGADSLGGTGTAELEPTSDGQIELIARTYRTPRGFDECASCPHVFRIHVFRWGPGGFERTREEPVPSPYSTFVGFIQRLLVDPGNTDAFIADRELIGQAKDFDWHRPGATWRVAPAVEEGPGAMTFFRGQQQAYRVSFEMRGGDWVITGFEPVARSVE